MIDYLALRIPGDAPFTSRFSKVYSNESRNEKRWRKSVNYVRSASFEDCGYEALLHMSCVMTKKPIHKVEILRAGDKTLPEMREIVGGIFDVDPDLLEVMRTDLTADVPEVEVDFFKRHTVTQFKRRLCEFGTHDVHQTVAQGISETLYAGKKPNQIRIYNKTAERRMQFQKMCARFARETAELPESTEIEAPDFQKIYGHGMWDVITRVERQVAARDVEKMGIVTLRALRNRADTLNPFEKMIFFNGTEKDEPRRDDWSFRDWHCGMDLRRRVEMFGLADVERQMKIELETNYKRTRKTFASFLRLSSNVVAIDAQGLRNAYATSTARQLLRAA